MPLIAGPGALTTIVIFGNLDDNPIHKPLTALVIFAVGVLIYMAFSFAGEIKRLVGNTGLAIFHKVMAMVIISIAVEFVFDGTAARYPQLITVEQMGAGH